MSIANSEIDQDSPLTSYLLKRLRDEWRLAICRPPSYTTVGIRRIVYAVDSIGEVRNFTYSSSGVLSTHYDTQSYVRVAASIPGMLNFSQFNWKWNVSGLGFYPNVELVCGAQYIDAGQVRICRAQGLFNSGYGAYTGLLSGSNEATVIATNDTFVNVLTWTHSGITVTYRIKARITAGYVEVIAGSVITGHASSPSIAVQAIIYKPITISANA